MAREGNKVNFNLEMAPNLYALARARVNGTYVGLILEGVYHVTGSFNATFYSRLIGPAVWWYGQPQLGDKTKVTVRTQRQIDAHIIAGHEQEFGQQIVEHFKTNQPGFFQLQTRSYMRRLLTSNLKNTAAFMFQ